MVTLQNGSGTHFGASQCISVDLAAAPAARCGYSLRVPSTDLSIFGIHFYAKRKDFLKFHNFHDFCKIDQIPSFFLTGKCSFIYEVYCADFLCLMQLETLYPVCAKCSNAFQFQGQFFNFTSLKNTFFSQSWKEICSTDNSQILWMLIIACDHTRTARLQKV